MMDAPQKELSDAAKLENLPTLADLSRLKLEVEALLFSAETAMEVSELRSHLGEVSLSEVRLALRELARDYEGRAFRIFEFGGKYQLRTRDEYAELVRKQFAAKPKSLSKSALETLAIIAYQQPVTRAQINAIRNVDCSSIIQSLKDRDLIYVSGQRKEVGNPLEYKTTPKFLEVFGLSKLEDLPSLRSLQMSADERQQVTKALAALHGEEEPTPTAEEIAFPDTTVDVSAEEVALAEGEEGTEVTEATERSEDTFEEAPVIEAQFGEPSQERSFGATAAGEPEIVLETVESPVETVHFEGSEDTVQIEEDVGVEELVPEAVEEDAEPEKTQE